MSEIEPFDITVPEHVLDDLKDRLGRTRWPDQIPDTGWDYGTDLAYLQELCAYWRDEYDWRAHEATLKSWDHFAHRDRRAEPPLHPRPIAGRGGPAR